MDEITKQLLEQVAGLHEIPAGAYNIRENGKGIGRASTANIDIIPREDGMGINVRVKAGTKKESVHIPVVISQSGLTEAVYNDFYIGADADVFIVAGCGIHNSGDSSSKHDGIHRFYLEEGAKVKYVEKHYGAGDGRGERIMNPVTEVYLREGSYMEMETTQLKGVDSTHRKTIAKLDKNATLIIKEKLLTHGTQSAKTAFEVELNGENCSCNVSSRSVAKEQSAQLFVSHVDGNAKCYGHTECDAIIMDDAKISAVPEISANHPEAELVHEAAIGKIAGEQLVKLMTLGLTEKEAENRIINGFLK